jgi:hypothetical protein
MSKCLPIANATESNKDQTLRGLTRAIAAGLLAATVLPQVRAQAIFTCIDAKGHRLTADRPIPECLDREQRELNASGTLKRKIGPTLTAEERAAEEEKAKVAAEERNRQLEEKKRERALLTRYPNKATHDAERVKALSSVDDAIAAARKAIADLVTQRKRQDIELEFYQRDPAKAPASLKRQIEETEQHIAAQQRFVDNQDSEKKRVNARFDEELVTLRQLWAQRSLPGVAAAVAAPASAARRQP